MSSPAVEPGATVGSLLLQATDLGAGARALEQFLSSPESRDGRLLRRLGIDDRFAQDLAAVLPSGGVELTRECELGVAWVAGRRSVVQQPTWEPVITSGDTTAEGVDRMTAETLIGLIVGARERVRVFSAYVDRGGLEVLAVSLAAASRRGVVVTVGYAAGGDRTDAGSWLRARLHDRGDSRFVRIEAIPDERPFPHVKLVAVDGEKAYLGSANLTWPALTSNVEIGALVSGSHVVTLERCFDELIDPPVTE